MSHKRYAHVIFEALHNLGKFQEVLDLGCGDGRIINDVIQFSSRNLYCTDIDFSKLKKLYQLMQILEIYFNGLPRRLSISDNVAV